MPNLFFETNCGLIILQIQLNFGTWIYSVNTESENNCLNTMTLAWVSTYHRPICMEDSLSQPDIELILFWQSTQNNHLTNRRKNVFIYQIYLSLQIFFSSWPNIILERFEFNEKKIRQQILARRQFRYYTQRFVSIQRCFNVKRPRSHESSSRRKGRHYLEPDSVILKK